MKMYFFSNIKWGVCYHIMAKDKKEAIKKVKEFVKNGAKDKFLISDFNRKEITIGKNDFAIIEYDEGEVNISEYN